MQQKTSRAMSLNLESPPLLEAGIKYMSMDMLSTFAVEPFPQSVRRPILFSNLKMWIGQAVGLGLKGELWVDGSFLTEKQEPNDIDCVLIIDAFPSDSSVDTIQNVERLLDKNLAATTFGLDLYTVWRRQDSPQVEMISYWRGWFGYCRDGVTAKGIARIEI